jgi:hypothetical protein
MGSFLSFFLLRDILLLFFLLLNLIQSLIIVHGLNQSQIVLQRFRNDIFIQCLCCLILHLKVLHLLIVLVLFILIVTVNLYIQEEVEKRFLLHLLCLLLASFLFIFLLHYLHSNVLALLPVHLVTRTLLYHFSVQIELLVELTVSEPLVLSKVEVDPKFF